MKKFLLAVITAALSIGLSACADKKTETSQSESKTEFNGGEIELPEDEF